MRDTIMNRLLEGNLKFQRAGEPLVSRRRETAMKGQSPYAIVITCADSRVIPEQIFSADLGELFVIRVAGNVLGPYVYGSVEYAAGHLGCHLVVVLGHTGCGAVQAALHSGAEGNIRWITDEILESIGEERDPDNASRIHVRRCVKRLSAELKSQNDPALSPVEVRGALYHLESGSVEWLD